MNYAKFRELLRDGETATIDFKIQADAFLHSDIATKAELAKDICALSNNGNVASYVIVGVSDDGKHFKSVTNKNLTDDRLQDFCKKAIFPPPRVRLQRETWAKALPAHRSKEFVIIQVGPQPRQVFRLAQDFVDYKANVCLRRNEVWIRRNATSDLATPEEIVRLAAGQPIRENPEDTQKQAERETFSRASFYDQREIINSATQDVLRKIGYKLLPDKHRLVSRDLVYGGGFAPVTYYKKTGSTIILVCALGFSSSFTKEDLKGIYFKGYFDERLAEWNVLPKPITRLTRKSIRAIRRIWLVSTIVSAPVSRISKAFPHSRRLGEFLHFYRQTLNDWVSSRHTDKPIFISSSSELLVLDKIRSRWDYMESLHKAIEHAERETVSLISPPDGN